MCWRNYSQTLLLELKIEHISESVVKGFIQFVFIACQVWAIEIY